MTPSAGIEPGTHWWKASAVTTAPTLLPTTCVYSLCHAKNYVKLQYSVQVYTFPTFSLCYKGKTVRA